MNNNRLPICNINWLIMKVKKDDNNGKRWIKYINYVEIVSIKGVKSKLITDINIQKEDLDVFKK